MFISDTHTDDQQAPACAGPRRTTWSARGKKLALTTAACAVIGAGTAAAAAPANAMPAYPRGYVSDAYLRSAATTNSTPLARITNQYVEIICYTSGQSVNGTAKWFKAQYYSSVGYLSASVVSQQPTVGPC